MVHTLTTNKRYQVANCVGTSRKFCFLCLHVTSANEVSEYLHPGRSLCADKRQGAQKKLHFEKYPFTYGVGIKHAHIFCLGFHACFLCNVTKLLPTTKLSCKHSFPLSKKQQISMWWTQSLDRNKTWEKGPENKVEAVLCSPLCPYLAPYENLFNTPLVNKLIQWWRSILIYCGLQLERRIPAAHQSICSNPHT